MRRRLATDSARPPMWVVDRRFWKRPKGLSDLDAVKAYTSERDEWLESRWAVNGGDMDGFDPFEDGGYWLMDEAEQAIRRGEVW